MRSAGQHWSERPIRWAGRALAPVLAGLSVSLIMGCNAGPDDGYDPSMRYLLRTDPIILKLPPSPPQERHPGGQLDDWLRGLAERGAEVLDPRTLSATERTQLQEQLTEAFGTPAQPILLPEDAPNHDAPNPLGITRESLALGSKVYKELCSVCHGTAGDGRGPTGAWVHPSPRDFRQSQLKFISTPGGSGQPTRADIHRILRLGISGNSMPSFALLAPKKLEAVTDYTIYLSIRGTVERELLIGLMSDDGPSGTLASVRDRVIRRWAEARSIPTPVEPPALPREAQAESVRRGAKLFHTTGCFSCHRDYGRESHLLHDIWGTAVRPTNLTLGEYRGGSSATDLFTRVRCGIPASGMPALNETVSDADVWDLVRFLQALPIPQQLPDEIRATIYPLAK